MTSEKIEAASEHIRQAFLALGVVADEDEHLKKTPDRVARYWSSLFGPYVKSRNPNAQEFGTSETLTTFDADGLDQLIMVDSVNVGSACIHHLLPFYGKAYMGYIPDKKILGLSKFGRIVDFYSAEPGTQEFLTRIIGKFLMTLLEPKFLGVVIRSQHTCFSCRGAKKPEALMITSFFNPSEWSGTKQEFFSLLNLQ